MLYGYIMLGTAIGLVLLAAWIRMEQRRKRLRLSLEPSDTFLSVEVRRVVSNAGGIYVSLALAASFLKLGLAEQYQLLGIRFDPLAALALVLALVQPLLLPEK